jgi:hypothetical protein
VSVNAEDAEDAEDSEDSEEVSPGKARRLTLSIPGNGPSGNGPSGNRFTGYVPDGKRSGGNDPAETPAAYAHPI